MRNRIKFVGDILFSCDHFQTPKLWFSVWKGPLQPEQYLRSLVKKARALTEDWLPSALQNQTLARVLNLSQLMSPEAFVSVLKQHTARLTGFFFFHRYESVIL